jgi:hypothetical protein
VATAKFLSKRKKISTEEKISGYRREKKFLPKKKFPAIGEKISSLPVCHKSTVEHDERHSRRIKKRLSFPDSLFNI